MNTMKSTRKLQDLVKRVAQQESQLDALRQKLHSRLARLNRRREELRTALQSVEAEIAIAAPGQQVNEQPVPAQAAARKPQGSGSAQQPAKSKLSLAKLLIQFVREGKGKPLAMAELKEQTIRRGFSTTSSNLPKMVETRAYGLVQRGLLRRDSASGGFCLAASTNGRKAAAPRAAASSKTGVKTGTPSLRAILVDVFKKSGRTLSVSELVEQVRKTGYRSKSQDFKNLLWVSLGKIPELERDPKGGYRLRKGKA